MDATLALPILIGLIAVALLFDFLNGLHDAANSIATIVSTRVLRPQYAVLWAAFFNFIAFLFFGLHVAQTVGTGIIDAAIVDPQVIFGALMGAIVWNLLTWALGIPSSSSHALIGGLIGAGTAKAGLSAIVWSGALKTSAAIVLSPSIGLMLALLLVLITSWLFSRTSAPTADRRFRRLQLVSAALYSLGHGGNDAQKTMGIIAVLLYAHGIGRSGEFHVPFWVVMACQTAMAAGTLFGGWRIVHTMGSKITKLSPMQGFCAE
ncbi:MAG: phosphate transporter, partial [Bradyrhizobium sp.]|nr:phosphate transporter [Bradyrhizobium sp.]